MEGWVCDQERSAYPLVDPGERASGRKLGVVQIRRRIGDEPLTILCRSTRKHRREFHDGPTNPDRQLVPIDWRSLRRTKADLPPDWQFALESTVRDLEIEVDDVIAIAEKIDIKLAPQSAAALPHWRDGRSHFDSAGTDRKF